jgi:hypothetical protein
VGELRQTLTFLEAKDRSWLLRRCHRRGTKWGCFVRSIFYGSASLRAQRQCEDREVEDGVRSSSRSASVSVGDWL